MIGTCTLLVEHMRSETANLNLHGFSVMLANVLMGR